MCHNFGINICFDAVMVNCGFYKTNYAGFGCNTKIQEKKNICIYKLFVRYLYTLLYCTGSFNNGNTNYLKKS